MQTTAATLGGARLDFAATKAGRRIGASEQRPASPRDELILAPRRDGAQKEDRRTTAQVVAPPVVITAGVGTIAYSLIGATRALAWPLLVAGAMITVAGLALKGAYSRLRS